MVGSSPHLVKDALHVPEAQPPHPTRRGKKTCRVVVTLARPQRASSRPTGRTLSSGRLQERSCSSGDTSAASAVLRGVLTTWRAGLGQEGKQRHLGQSTPARSAQWARTARRSRQGLTGPGQKTPEESRMSKTWADRTWCAASWALRPFLLGSRHGCRKTWALTEREWGEWS